MDRSEMSPIARVMRTIPLFSASWRKSSHSNPSGDCVELRGLAGGKIAIRHSRNSDGAILMVACAEVAAFIRGVKEESWTK
ncbi:MAG TPA: DUF397 domain-containing protein [Pseudonocardiaceae bacterium]